MLLQNKKGLIFGVRNARSIPWGCAQSFAREGAQLAFSYYSEREEPDVKKLVQSLPGHENAFIHKCDLTKDEDVTALYSSLAATWDQIDFVLHGVAFAKHLDGRFVDISRDGYWLALNSSAYSFVAAAQGALPMMKSGGSLLTFTYLGGERVVPNYNVMGIAKAALEFSVRYMAADLGPIGIRVNAVSPGPTMTCARHHRVSRSL